MARTEAQRRGQLGEDFCAQLLLEQGYTILERNYRWEGRAEVDLIAMRQMHLYFIEIKTRSELDSYGGLAYSIRPAQVKRIQMASKRYIQTHKLSDYSVHILAAYISINESQSVSSCRFIDINA